MILTSDFLDAKEAYECGLVAKVVQNDVLQEAL